MRKKCYKIYTLGCKVNQYDTLNLNRKMIAAGFSIGKKDIDLAIINTCCVTKTAISKCKRIINKARKENPGAKIVVMGCWPKGYQEEVERLEVDLIWEVGELDKLVQKISNNKAQMSNQCQSPNVKLNNNRSRFFIKIQDGCEQFCSYCIIPYTRGKLSSRPMNEIIKEVEHAINRGYREVVLCGIHLGLYGYGTKNNLVKLLIKLVRIKDLGRIRLSSIEVSEVNDDLIKLMASPSKLCKHLHIPLQSGSNKILKLMNRPYSLNYYKNKINKIKKAIPDIAVTTDVIVGFPNESGTNFKETYNFIKKMQFSRLHVFPFSAHEKTPAAKMKNKVEKQEIEKRAKKLRQLGKKLAADYKKRFIGKELDIVIENKIGNKYKGKTEYYFDVEFKKLQVILIEKKVKISQIVKIRFDNS